MIVADQLEKEKKEGDTKKRFAEQL